MNPTIPGVPTLVVTTKEGSGASHSHSIPSLIKSDADCQDCGHHDDPEADCCDVTEDFDYIGYAAAEHTYEQTLPEDLTYPSTFWIGMDSNYTYVGIATSEDNLLELLEDLNLGDFTIEAGVLTYVGHHRLQNLMPLNSAPESEGNMMAITTGTYFPIIDVLGSSTIDISTGEERDDDTVFKGLIADLNLKFLKFPDGPTSWLWHSTGEEQYGIDPDEVTAIGQSPAFFLDGMALTTPGYHFFNDYVGYMPDVGSPDAVLVINMLSSIMEEDFTDLQAEIDSMINSLDTAGVAVARIQLGLELCIPDIDNIITDETVYADAASTMLTWLDSNYPDILVSGDTYNTDDTTRPHEDWPTAVIALPFDGFRQYYQFHESLNTWDLNWDRVMDFQNFVTDYMSEYSGFQLYVEQSTVKSGNPTRLKHGEALIYAAMQQQVVSANLINSDVIGAYCHYSLSRLVSGTNRIYPAYYAIKDGRDIMINDGAVDGSLLSTGAVTLTGDGMDALLWTVVKKTGVEQFDIYIVNPTGATLSIPLFLVDGTPTMVNATGAYGDPFTDTPSSYSATGVPSVTLNPYSRMKITTQL